MAHISTLSYTSLREALSVVTWYKKSFERLVKSFLKCHPEILARLSFSVTKRETADTIVDLLEDDESRYSDLTLEIMGQLAAMDRFPDFDRLEDKERLEKQRAAVQAVADLKSALEKESSAKAEAEAVRQEIKKYREDSQRATSFNAELDRLKETYLLLMQEQDHPQERGLALEKLLNNLFALAFFKQGLFC